MHVIINVCKGDREPCQLAADTRQTGRQADRQTDRQAE
jgi:hypothetical protein